MDRQPVLVGERLELRPLRESDWDTLWPVANDRALWAMHPMHDRWQEPVFRAFFADALAQGGALLAIERATGRTVGSSRYQAHDAADGGRVEIGWTFIARDMWGSGLNDEMKRLMLGHAFRFVERVVFRVGETNWRSRRAVEKLGAQLTDEREGSGALTHLVYALDRADWRG